MDNGKVQAESGFMGFACHSLGRLGYSALSCFALVCLIQAFKKYSCQLVYVEGGRVLYVHGSVGCRGL